MFNQIKQYLNRKTFNNQGDNYRKNQTLGKKSYFLDCAKASWNKRDYKTFATEAYIKNVIAHKAINIISRACSSVKLKPTIASSKGLKSKMIEAPEIERLLSNPNPKESGKELLYSLYAYRQINGNAYLLADTACKSGKINELYSLRPDRISIFHSQDFMPVKYQYFNGSRRVDYTVDNVSGISQILHLKNFNPLDDFYGLSSIEAAAYSIDQHNQAAAWNQALLQNGARPSGAIVVNSKDGGSNMTDEQFDRLKSMVDESFSGARNSGRPMVLEGGLDWKEMSLSPRDMDFISCKNSAARDIALAFGVPPQLLGIPGDNTYSNLKEARIALWEQTIIPMLDNTLESISNWFSNFYCKRVMIDYCLESIPIFSDKRESLWERVQNADFLTTDEKREAVGYGPIQGQD